MKCIKNSIVSTCIDMYMLDTMCNGGVSRQAFEEATVSDDESCG